MPGTRPCPIVSIIDRKGGAGKTTIMHHLTAGFALDGFKVLAIEADDNPRLRAILVGLEEEGEQELATTQTTMGLFEHPANGTSGATFDVGLNRLWENVPSLDINTVHRVRGERGWSQAASIDYIPGSESIKDVETSYANRALKESGFVPDAQLSIALGPSRSIYDVEFIDSPPSLTRILRNIIAASTHVIIIVEFDFASLEDYRRTRRAYQRICKALQADGYTPPQTFVVLNKFSRGNARHQALYQAYTQEHQEIVRGQKVTRPAIIKEPILGVIPMDYDTLDNAAAINRSVHQTAPLSDIGTSMYEVLVKTRTVLNLKK